MAPGDDLPAPVSAPRVTLAQVAAEAGVSPASASRALAGTVVRPAIKTRVLEAASRLGYVPDLAAQAVARGTSNTVALVVDSLRSPFAAEITRGVVHAAARRDLTVTVTAEETHPGDLLEMIATARSLRPRALLLATARALDPAVCGALEATLAIYRSSGGAVGVVGDAGLPFTGCAFDEALGATALGRHLAALGYRRPLVLNGSSERRTLAARADAIVGGLVEGGIAPGDVRRVEMPTTRSRALPADRLIALEHSDVVVCVEESVVPAVYRHIRGRGLRVGVDVAVAGFGGYGIADALRPHLTTVRVPLHAAGESVLDLALAGDDGVHRLLPPSLRLRTSAPRRPTTRAAPIAAPPAAVVATLAVVVPSGSREGLSELIDAFTDLVDRAGARMLVVPAPDDPARLADAVAGCDAVVLCLPASELIAAAASLPRSCAITGQPAGDDIRQVSLEIVGAVQAVLESLRASGHRRVGYLRGAGGAPLDALRERAIELFHATHPPDALALVALDDTGDDALAAQLAGVTAVLASSDERAAAVLRLAAERGIDVPGALSVVGSGGGAVGEASTPTLTSVRIPFAAAAHAAWHLVSSDDPVGEPRSLASTLVLRDSTAFAAPR